jgi:hypothetical protein
MGLGLPFFLVGLAALAVPVVIHLWSKNAQKSIDFGSIRFLRETETKTMRSLLPSQWLLLLLRLLLLVLIVIILAEPFTEKKPVKYDTIFLVDTDYADLPWFQQWKDTLSESSKAFWLTDDFPSIDKEAVKATSNYWELLSSPPRLDAEKVIVISPLSQRNFQAKRKRWPMDYQWIRLPSDPVKTIQLSYQKNDQAFSVMASYDEWSTSYQLQPATVAEPIVITYAIEASAEFQDQKNIFKAAFETLKALSPLTIESTIEQENADWVIWLSLEERSPSSNVISINPQLIQKWKKISNSNVEIASDLSWEDAVDIHLPEKILSLMAPEIHLAQAADMRSIDENSFVYEASEWDGEKVKSDASQLVWIILLMVLISERWWSYKSERK